MLSLYAENDRLKLRELDDRRRIEYLLKMSGLGPAESAYFLPDGPYPERPSSGKENTIVVNPGQPAKGMVECTSTGAVRRRRPVNLDGMCTYNYYF